jgi:hypothetical protein
LVSIILIRMVEEIFLLELGKHRLMRYILFYSTISIKERKLAQILVNSL